MNDAFYRPEHERIEFIERHVTRIFNQVFSRSLLGLEKKRSERKKRCTVSRTGRFGRVQTFRCTRSIKRGFFPPGTGGGGERLLPTRLEYSRRRWIRVFFLRNVCLRRPLSEERLNLVAWKKTVVRPTANGHGNEACY